MAETYLRKVYGVVEYLGRRYKGWQVQGSADQSTVSGAMTHCLGLLLPPLKCHKFMLVGASRTDAGVNAKGNAFHIKLHYEKGATPLASNDFRDGFNSYLRETNHSIRVLGIRDVWLKFHAHRCLHKTYRYTVTTQPSVFLEDRCAVIPGPLDLSLVRSAAALLTGTINVRSFSKVSRDPSSPQERVLYDVSVSPVGSEVRMTFTGPGFSWHQVRYMAGALIECGSGRLSLADVSEMLSGKTEKRPPLAPPQGLCLLEVVYDPCDIQPFRDDRLY